MSIYLIDDERIVWQQDDQVRDSFGGKAAGLVAMKRIGLNVPPAFIMGCKLSLGYAQHGNSTLDQIMPYVLKNIGYLESETNKKFGAATKANFPLLLSVRSGAPVSMPGMMDTVLNVGLNDKSVKVLGNATTHEFAWDSYRRFIYSYATTVLDLDKKPFDELLDAARHFCVGGILTLKMNQHLVAKFQTMCGGAFPQNVQEQLRGCIEAVFRSWNSERAIVYRKKENISDELGTGVVVQSMVFGNFNNRSATGVYFTMNPVDGTPEPYGDFLVNAQGEDVVDGSSNPRPIDELYDVMPKIYDELIRIGRRLEKMYEDMCDIEFTIENGKLYFLQVRKGKRSTVASYRIPIELVRKGYIDTEKATEMVMAIVPKEQQSEAKSDVSDFVHIGNGLVAAEGDVEGVIAFNCESAIRFHNEGKKVILVSNKTDPEDMPGIIAADGIVTFTGGLVSHAAVVARSWDKPCIVGLGLKMNTSYYVSSDHMVIDSTRYNEGDIMIIKPSEKGSVYVKHAS